MFRSCFAHVFAHPSLIIAVSIRLSYHAHTVRTRTYWTAYMMATPLPPPSILIADCGFRIADCRGTKSTPSESISCSCIKVKWKRRNLWIFFCWVIVFLPPHRPLNQYDAPRESCLTPINQATATAKKLLCATTVVSTGIQYAPRISERH